MKIENLISCSCGKIMSKKIYPKHLQSKYHLKCLASGTKKIPHSYPKWRLSRKDHKTYVFT